MARTFKIIVFFGICLLLAGSIVVRGINSRIRAAVVVKQETLEQAIPTVAVAQPGGAGAAATLNLPGRLEAYARAPLYARVSGYLKSWKYDIGAQVKAGQLLAEIEAPDLDQQVRQAQASVVQRVCWPAWAFWRYRVSVPSSRPVGWRRRRSVPRQVRPPAASSEP